MDEEILKRYPEDFDRLQRLIEFSEKDLIAGGFTLKREHTDAFYGLVIAWWVKANKTARAVKLLCKNALSSDAEALSRVLVETMINLLYLCHADQDERAIWFFAHQAIEKKKLVGILRKERLKLIYSKLDPEKEKEIQEVYESALDRRSRKSGSLLDRLKFWFRLRCSRWGIFPDLWPSSSSWSGEHVARMAKLVSAPNFYDLPYRQASAVVHGTDLENHINLTDADKADLTKGIKFLAPVDDKHIASTLTTATLALDQILKAVYRELQIPRASELEKLSAEIIGSIPRAA